ncbi:putative O-glycosylation ligase, exosortase A system-associated [Catenovulum sediminis]|uniref:putative O-glycosylation ligase, exosortase A system-associated n=1 Tax=Catenovulum sediminis TaxID=1740262 RepID=UPI00117E4267|nr:putative O-glycosylation ligase, exosortase A system-associated [Catenovulum sediminis]
MRDLLLLAALPFLIYVALKRPFIGIALWFWSSMVQPNLWAYGFAASIRWNLLFAAISIIGFFLHSSKNRQATPPDNPIWQSYQAKALYALVLVFFAHTTLTTVMTVGGSQYVWQEWSNLMKIMLLFAFIIMICKKKLHFITLAWAAVLSVSYKGMLEGLKVAITAGGYKTRPISTTFIDNNLTALGLLLSIPFILILIDEYKNNFKIKLGLQGMLLANVLGVVGTHSRGGFIGLIVLGYYYIKTSKRKFMSILLVLVATIAISLVTGDEWAQRMNTVKTADADSSFMYRVVSWKMSVLMAMERPLFGAGFDAIIWPPVWENLKLSFDSLDFIETPKPGPVLVAHSIYFQVIGDHGFLGIILYLSMMLACFLKLRSLSKRLDMPNWYLGYANRLRMSVVVFGISGAALSAAYFEIIFIICGITVALSKLVPYNQNSTLATQTHDDSKQGHRQST